MSDFKHENLSSILGTEAEVFSLDMCDAPPTFREQKEPKDRSVSYFQTEKQLNERKESSGVLGGGNGSTVVIF